MRIVPRQLEFDNDIPNIAGNADYAAENELLLAMDAIISQSGIEEIVITSFLELAVFDQAARLFAADKPVVFRLTQKEQVAVQERAIVALRVAILRKHTGSSLRRFAQLLSHSPLYQWFCQINRFATVKIPGKSTIDDYEKQISSTLSSEQDQRLLQLASQPGEVLEAPVDMSECFMDTTCVKANIHFPVDWVLLRDAARTLIRAIRLIRGQGLKHRMPEPGSFVKRMNQLCIQMTHARRRKDSKRVRKQVLRTMKKLSKTIQKHGERYRMLLAENRAETEWSEAEAQLVLDRIDNVLIKLPEAIHQAHERIIGERRLANEEKIQIGRASCRERV